MKYLSTTLTLLLLFLCTSLMAQEMSVKRFEEATTDLAARTKPRQDLNGNDCALIKVQIAAQGVTFEGNVMGDVAFAKNEYWVYMSEGSGRLKVIHPSCPPLEVSFADYGISSLHGKTTYLLTLLQQTINPASTYGSLDVASTPDDADVEIDGKAYGKTPLSVEQLSEGEHTVSVSKFGYYKETVSVNVSNNETASVNISLKVSKTCRDDNHPHMINLGLPSGTMWACCNVDADKPEGYGGYYAWGETTTKRKYNWEKYECDNRDSGSSICGTQYDVAHVKWGGSWQMPTFDNINELLDKCKSEWTTVNGVKGRRFTGPNGGSIFLPASGARFGASLRSRGKDGDYWSGTQDTSSGHSAYELGFNSYSARWYGCTKSYGLSVRPVAK